MAEEGSDKKSDQKLSTITADMTVAIIALLVALSFLGLYIREVLDWYQRLLEWFYSKNWQGINFWLTIIFSVINAGLLVFIVFTIRRYSRLTEIIQSTGGLKEELPAPPEEEAQRQWGHIRDLANSQNPSDWNMAVLRADALLDDILKQHRLRNMIAHDPLEQHTRETIIHALRSYDQALRDLGMFEEKV
ncbi:MAG: hypothetical protein HYW91_01045 [Candidatus Sungbacteria bacterium]|nr:hypothetical protein [Candidatus Sungbacteria bacterium]